MELAIKSHETCGKEVIELLKMLGGSNIHNLSGNNSYAYYVNDHNNIIRGVEYIFGDEDMQFFTIEEFLEKYPFKVGDFISIPEYESEVRIHAMKWCVYSNTVLYMVYRVDEEEWYTVEELLDYNDIEDYKSRYTKSKDNAVISSKTLGIKGHSSRSEDVKSLLTMLGGRIDVEDLPFDNDIFVLYIGNNKCVYPSTVSSFNGVIYSLEEFEEKFPYKVGDKVIIKCKNKKAIVNNVVWRCDTIVYDLKYDGTEGKWTTEYLQPYKEKTITIDDFKANTKEWLIDKLESMSKDNALQAICNIYDELHKPKYPKTYEECCDKLDFKGGFRDIFLSENEYSLYISFIKLIRCRDSYWKIAGEQMGLGKPWNPDFTNNDEERYGIYTAENKVKRDFCGVGDVNTVLTFPTEEIRDAFYENFKDLIEQCKELL